jgi:hypothetical protein
MKKVFFVLALIIIAGLGVWKYKQQHSSTSAIVQYVPDDTAFYMGGTTSKSLADFFCRLANFRFFSIRKTCFK